VARPIFSPMSGSTQPPRARRLAEAYASEEGQGILLRATVRITDAEKGGSRSTLTAQPARAKELLDDVELLRDVQLLPRASDGVIEAVVAVFASKIDAQATKLSQRCDVVIAGGKTVQLEAPSPADLSDAVKLLPPRVEEGKHELLQIVAEAEDPSWLFLQALRMIVPDKDALCLQRTFEVMEVVERVVSVPAFEAKEILRVARPSQVSNDVRPLIPVPRHRSLPSGHAATAYALAVVLAEITALGVALDGVAAVVAGRREKAGLHTHLDSEAGKKLGTAVGDLMVRAAADTSPEYRLWRGLFAAAVLEWP
jgi:hypothetical protein